jgi:hypothetical protein
MNAIRIETTINSETLYLPQLTPLLGKDVEIVVKEIAKPVIHPATVDLTTMEAAATGLQDYDFDAWRESRDVELREASINDPA